MPADTGGPFWVRYWPTDQTKPYEEEAFTRFGPALERAQEIASAIQYRSAQVVDQNSTVYAQFNALWIIPRAVR